MNVIALALVVLNAHVVTLDPVHPVAKHVAVVDGHFTYVGDDAAAARRAAGPGAASLDARGATIVPGFDDAHVHFGLSLTIGADDAIIFGADHPEPNREELADAIVKASRRPHDPDRHDWIFVTVRVLPKGVARGRDLPHVDRPIFVVTEHGGILNAAAQKAAAFTDEETPDGQVRGRLLPAALDRVVKSLPPRVLRAGALRFLAECARDGLTSVQLMDELPTLFDGLRREGLLTARIRMMVFGYRFETSRYVPTWKPVDPSWVQLDALKYFHDDWARLPRAELARIYEEVAKSNRPVVMHVLSRAALRTLLDQLERLELTTPGGAHHFRLDHVDELPPDLARRVAKLGLRICTNPAMLPEWRNEHAFPLHTMIDATIGTCIGSDYVGRHDPPRPLAPLNGLQMAVTHGGYGQAERVSVDDALRAFTIGSAAAEDRTDLGVIRVGMLADFVGLSDDPAQVPSEKISALQVRFTVVGGKIVYEVKPTVPRPPPPSIGAEGSTPPTVKAPPSTIGPVQPPSNAPAPKR